MIRSTKPRVALFESIGEVMFIGSVIGKNSTEWSIRRNVSDLKKARRSRGTSVKSSSLNGSTICLASGNAGRASSRPSHSLATSMNSAGPPLNTTDRSWAVVWNRFPFERSKSVNALYSSAYSFWSVQTNENSIELVIDPSKCRICILFGTKNAGRSTWWIEVLDFRIFQKW